MKTTRNLIQIGLLCATMLQALTSGAQPVTKIAASYHSLFLKGDGSLWAMGRNLEGQLGDGTYNNTNWPEQIVASNVTAIAAGGFHSLLLKRDSSLWAIGDNSLGQLGDGTYPVNSPFGTNQPEQIVASNVTAVAAGSAHSLFLKNNGSLWGMGKNDAGQLGDGTYSTNAPYFGTNQPEQVVASNITAIAVGGSHSLFLMSGGSLWGMGWNREGELGDGTYGNSYLGWSTNRPEQIVASNVMAIAAGSEHSLFLKSDGSLWAMGDDYYGQLGDGRAGSTSKGSDIETNLPEQIVASNVTAIAAGYFHSLFLKSDGSLWAMGHNNYGQLGDGTTINRPRPKQIVASSVTAIAAGSDYSLFLKSDGSLWAMGYNYYGSLGDGTFDNTNRPERIVVNTNYNQICCQLLSGGKLQFSFFGIAGTNYALDRASSLSPANWIPQATNPAGSFGALVFTNPPDATTNNFWRIRSVP